MSKFSRSFLASLGRPGHVAQMATPTPIDQTLHLDAVQKRMTDLQFFVDNFQRPIKCEKLIFNSMFLSYYVISNIMFNYFLSNTISKV